jgi:hypothetical protein
MENKKKNYLFRLGPLTFFPKDPEENKYLLNFQILGNNIASPRNVVIVCSSKSCSSW